MIDKMVKRNIVRLSVLLIALLSLCWVDVRTATPGGMGFVPAQDPTAKGSVSPPRTTKGSVPPRVRNLVRQAVAAVGLIFIREDAGPAGRRARPRGSAVLVRSDGVVVTNHHVILDNRTRKIYPNIFFSLAKEGVATDSPSNLYRLRPAVINREKDLALLRIEADSEGNPLPDSLVFPTIEIGDSRAIGLLDDLIIIGFPEKGGSSITLSQGTVQGQDVLENWIKTDARVIHGNSGGAAVDSEGKLIGIPTKVVADSQPIDSDGDGFPDAVRQYGAVGFLRPSHLVAAMLAQLGPEASDVSREMNVVKVMPATRSIKVSGIIKAAASGKPIAGARIGLVPLGSKTVTESNLLTWGGTNAEGKFALNKPVPPGRYTIRASALGYEAYMGDVEIDPKGEPVVIELRPSSRK